MTTQNALDGFVSIPIPCREPQQQGRQANMSGKAAEGTIYCIVRERGYRVEREAFIGQNIYGGDIRADFLIEGVAVFPDGLIIESKWQETAGSADEKFVYLVENIKKRYPCPTIIVYGGKGFRSGAVEWLKAQADGKRLYRVMSLEEFLAWTIRNL